MKKCPTCDKTFEDSMRFCQVDGTPLVDDAPAFDPYATIVSSPANPISTASSENVETIEPDVETPKPERAGAPIGEPKELLDLPAQSDPLKTMYASDSEMRDALKAEASAVEEPVIEMPPNPATPEPEPPSFIVRDTPTPSFGDVSPPPSPFSVSENVPSESAHKSGPVFDESATIIQPRMSNPFDSPPPAPVAEWTPPPAPDANWQNQEAGANIPFQAPSMETGSKNQTLPIISLVLGILSLCCYVSPITGIAALITGFMGMKNVNSDPSQYGGKGLAIAGMVTGGLFLLIGIVYWIFILFFGGLSLLMGR